VDVDLAPDPKAGDSLKWRRDLRKSRSLRSVCYTHLNNAQILRFKHHLRRFNTSKSLFFVILNLDNRFSRAEMVVVYVLSRGPLSQEPDYQTLNCRNHAPSLNPEWIPQVACVVTSSSLIGYAPEHLSLASYMPVLSHWRNSDRRGAKAESNHVTTTTAAKPESSHGTYLVEPVDLRSLAFPASRATHGR
jgi:hypothetical protein